MKMGTIKNRERARIAERKYYYLHKDEIFKRRKDRIKKNYEHYKSIWTRKNYENRIYRLEYSKINRKRLNELEKIRKKERRLKDKNYVIKERLRALLKCALKRYSNGKKFSSKKYGINWTLVIEQLKPFPKNLKDYHIDHIIPLCSFDLTNLEEIKKAFAPENHQWLLAKENMQKSDSIIERGRI